MRCFVIQPFRKPFNQRYTETYEPAVKEAGFEPYRVDMDPKVSIPIDDIESGIRNSACCFVDISIDNPNVWFELGFAIALKKPLCIVCEDSRAAPYPFDIQHRSIIFYSSASLGDFKKLEQSIVQRLTALRSQIATEQIVAPVQSPVASVTGQLDHFELSCLALVAADTLSTMEGITASSIRDAMDRAGYNGQATAIALHRLRKAGCIEDGKESDYNGNDYIVFRMTELGFDMLSASSDRLTLVWKSAATSGPSEDFSADLDDEIPF